MSITPRKKTEIETILTNKFMQEMVALEPGIRTILEIAADPEPRDNRWIAYEALKRMSQPLVGWDARHAELRTNGHYETLLEAFDQLLPDNEEEQAG